MLRRTLAAFVSLGLWAPWPTRALAVESPRACSSAHARLDYTALACAAGRLPPAERLAFVNNSINQRVDYAPDTTLHGEVDWWQTPTETLSLAQGDCEDFAIAKYFVLHDCGRLCGCTRLLYAIRTPPDLPGVHEAHVVVLGGGSADDPLVLDNINPLAVRLSQRSDLQPLLSFDVASLWRGTGGERVGDAASLLRPWRELLQRWRLQH